MIPLRDTLRPTHRPWGTWGLIAASLFVFSLELLFVDQIGSLFRRFGFIPARVAAPAAWGVSPMAAFGTLLTSLFIHGGWFHIAGNLLYLWIFGDDVEDKMGTPTFLFFFLCCGAVGNLAHALLFPLPRSRPLEAQEASRGCWERSSSFIRAHES